MPSIPAEAISLIGIELGSINTRAVLFDAVEDRYEFIAAGVVPSTHIEPFFDVGEGIYQSISRLQEITGRILLDNDGNLIMPSHGGGEGVDRLVLTTSCGNTLGIVIFGLLNDVSLDSVLRLANTTYGKVRDSVGINDRRPANVQLDAVLAADPDLVLFAGGTDGGASRSVTRVAQMISSVFQLMPENTRPHILYCGNSDLGKRMSETLERYTRVRLAPNIRPTIDNENLLPAQQILDEVVLENWFAQIGGLKRIVPICSVPPQLSNLAFERVICFLGRQYDPGKGVLGIDLGASHSVAAYANNTLSTLNTFPFGMGIGLSEVLQRTTAGEISKWLDETYAEEEVWDYLWQRSLFPQTVATSTADLEVELAAARQILRFIMHDLRLRNALPSDRFEPILISGSTINRTAMPHQALLTILDGIQPLGICPLILDKHNILPVLGAAAAINPLLAVQVLESTAFTNLATVVNAVSRARPGTRIMEARLEYLKGDFVDIEVKQGSIISIPLASGEAGLLHLHPTHRTEIEDLNISRDPVRVSGGVCGVVIDARGRPLKLPGDPVLRGEMFKIWASMLGIK